MIKSPRFRSASLLGLALGASVWTSSLFGAEPALTRLVPADAVLAISLEDLPSTRSRFNASALGRLINDSEIEKFVAPLRKNPSYQKFVGEVKAETGYSIEELIDFATGDVLLVVPGSSLRFAKNDTNVDLLVALDVGENEARIRELVAQQREKKAKDGKAVTDTTEDYNGATLHLVSVSKKLPGGDAAAKEDKLSAWTLYQGRLFLGSSREIVTGALDALAAGGLAESLSTAPTYRSVVERAGVRPDYVFFADMGRIFPMIVASIEASRSPDAQPNPMGIEPVDVLKALGVDTLQVLSGVGATAEDGTITHDVGITFTEARGITKMLAYREGPVARPDWIPSSWINVTSQNFSFADVYSELEQVLDRISPMIAGMALGQVKSFNRQLKIDIQRDLIGNLGPSVLNANSLPVGASAANPPPIDEFDQLLAISLADPASFERALNALKGSFLPPDGGPLEKREYLDRTYFAFAPEPAVSAKGTKGFAYAITDGWLLIGIGSAAPIEAVFQRMSKPEDSASFWSRSEVRDAYQSAPASAFSFQYTELPVMASALAASIAKTQASADGNARVVDAGAIPSPEVFAKYLGHAVTFGERKSDGLFFRFVVPANPAP